MALSGRQYTVTATAAQPFPVAAGSTRINVKEISFKAPTGNAAAVIIGNSNATAAANGLIQIEAGGGFTSGPFSDGSPIYADDFYVVGTAADIVHIYYVPY